MSHKWSEFQDQHNNRISCEWAKNISLSPNPLWECEHFTQWYNRSRKNIACLCICQWYSGAFRKKSITFKVRNVKSNSHGRLIFDLIYKIRATLNSENCPYFGVKMPLYEIRPDSFWKSGHMTLIPSSTITHLENRLIVVVVLSSTTPAVWFSAQNTARIRPLEALILGHNHSHSHPSGKPLWLKAWLTPAHVSLRDKWPQPLYVHAKSGCV